MAVYQKLASCDLFSSLSEESLRNLGAYSKARSFSDGQVLFRENGPAAHLYAVMEGQVQMKMAVPKGAFSESEVNLTTAEPGQVIGFWALIEPFVYPFSAVALTRGSLVAIDGQKLRSQMGSLPEFGCAITKQTVVVIAKRLKEAREVLGYERASRRL